MYNIEGLEWFVIAVRNLQGKRVCELGNQHIWTPAAKRFGISHEVARDWMLDVGVKEYVSIDVNGQDGALRADLSIYQVWEEMFEHFDIVTNIGTSEHVTGRPPLVKSRILSAQDNCFANMFYLCREGGTMIHQVPPLGYWKKHSPVHYKPGFPQTLAKACGSPLTGSEMVYLPTLSPENPLLMFSIRKESSQFLRFGGLSDDIEVNLDPLRR